MAEREIGPIARWALVEAIDRKHRHEARRRQPASLTPETAAAVAERKRYWLDLIAGVPGVETLLNDQEAFDEALRALALRPGIGLDEATIIRSIRLTELRQALEAGG